MNFNFVYLAYFNFLLKYRRTIIGPFWLLISPLIFIFLLGSLFARISSIDENVFIPHLAIGLITWTMISGFIVESTIIFQKNRSHLLQSNVLLQDIIISSITFILMQFLHQLLIIIMVLVYYDVQLTIYSLVSILGILFLITNGYWLSIVFGFIGARYRDLNEITQASMRIFMLATPIIWMPSEAGRGGALGPYLTFNPFYHFLEIVRAPLLNQTISLLSWAVVIGITIAGFAFAYFFYNRYHKQLPLWV